MKKSLFTVFFSLFALFSLQAQVCTPDPTATLPGYNPAPTDTLIAYLNVPYSQIFTLNVIPETTITAPIVGPVTVSIAKQTLVAIDSIAPGLSFACNVNGCSWTGGTSGCLTMSGTPTVAGLYRMRFNTNTKLAQAPFPGAPDNFDVPYPYIMKVVGPNALEDVLDITAFRFAPCQPNPATDFATLRYTYPTEGTLALEVMDMRGSSVLTNRIAAHQGLNQYQLEVGSLPTGMYIITLNDGVRVLKQKLMVK